MQPACIFVVGNTHFSGTMDLPKSRQVLLFFVEKNYLLLESLLERIKTENLCPRLLLL